MLVEHMSKLNQLLTALLISLLPSVAFATGGLTLRGQGIQIQASRTVSASDATVSQNGILVRASLNGKSGVTWTSSVGSWMQANRLLVWLKDGNADDTLTCASATLTGVDQLNRPITETIAPVTETAQLTYKAFSRVISTRFNLCLDGDSSDYAIVRADSRHVALPSRIVNSDIHSICLAAPSAGFAPPDTTAWTCTTNANLSALSSSLLSGQMTIDLTKIGLSVDTTYGPTAGYWVQLRIN